jgi:hypothetical protein
MVKRDACPATVAGHALPPFWTQFQPQNRCTLPLELLRAMNGA